MIKDFIIASSEKSGEDAAREVSLKIKAAGAGEIGYVFILFTPHYQPLSILKTIAYALKPKSISGLQVPSIIFEGSIVERGMAVCCFTPSLSSLKELFFKNQTTAGTIETRLRAALHEPPIGKDFYAVFPEPPFEAETCLSEIQIGLGKSFNIWGGGFSSRFNQRLFNIAEHSVEEGLLSFLGKGINMRAFKISGFLPLGRTFLITKILAKSNIITEINGQRADNIYKNYLEDKFDTFRRNGLFPFYPLMIKKDHGKRIIPVAASLDDGSLVCIGSLHDIKEGAEAQLTILHPQSLMENLTDMLFPVKQCESGLLFMVNTLTRKKILKDHAALEIAAIKAYLGETFPMIGFFSDYYLFPNKEAGNVEIETGNILLSLWKS
jgi:hypothetical protein